MITITGTLSKGWMNRAIGVVFDRDYYFDPAQRHTIDSLCNEYAAETFPGMGIFYSESNLGRIDYWDKNQVQIGGIQPNLILGLLLGADFVPADDRDADISLKQVGWASAHALNGTCGVSLHGLKPILPAPEALLNHDLVTLFDEQIAREKKGPASPHPTILLGLLRPGHDPWRVDHRPEALRRARVHGLAHRARQMPAAPRLDCGRLHSAVPAFRSDRRFADRGCPCGRMFLLPDQPRPGGGIHRPGDIENRRGPRARAVPFVWEQHTPAPSLHEDRPPALAGRRQRDFDPPGPRDLRPADADHDRPVAAGHVRREHAAYPGLGQTCPGRERRRQSRISYFIWSRATMSKRSVL